MEIKRDMVPARRQCGGSLSNHIFLFFLLLFLSHSTALYALDTSLYEYSAPVVSEFKPGEPARVPLPQELLSKSRLGLQTDLRVVNDQGTEIPFVIQNRIEPGEVSQSFAFKITSYDQKQKKSLIVVKRPDKAPHFREVEFVTASEDFKKKVAIEASPDGKNWSPVATDMIFDFSSSIALSKIVVEIPRTDQPHLRLTLEDESTPLQKDPEFSLAYEGLQFKALGINTKSFRIAAIRGRTGPEQEEKPVYDILEISPEQFTVTADKEGNSLVNLGRIHLPVSEVVLDVANPYFYRQVEVVETEDEDGEDERVVGRGPLYRMTGMKNPENRLSFGETTLRHAWLRITNNNNPPLKLNGIELKWTRKDLTFIPEPGRNYQIFAGSDEAETPTYELQKVLSGDTQGRASYQELRLGAIEKNSSYKPGKGPKESRARREKTLFTAVILLVVALIGFWLVRLLRQVSAKPPSGA